MKIIMCLFSKSGENTEKYLITAEFGCEELSGGNRTSLPETDT